MSKFTKIAALSLGASILSMSAAQAVEIEYWQYVFDTRVKAVDQLIEQFQAENPDITVKHVTFPYADYATRVVAATMAGEGPDVVQYFYGWLDNFIAQDLLQPLNTEVFPTAEIEDEFFGIVSALKRDDAYYGLPTAVRSLALFYNKKLFEEAGVTAPPATLDEMVEVAKKIAKTDGAGNFEVEGITLDMAGQDHHWWREVLVRQFGGAPYSDDNTTVTYNQAGGEKALEFYTNLQLKDKVGLSGFMDEGQAAFRAGRAGMTIDGTFRLGAFRSIEDFEWGVAELPAGPDGTKSNYASYFANGIGSGATGEELEAAQKFLAYISSEEAMQIWLEEVGELPARRSAALTDKNLADPIFSPFLKGLDYAHTTLFVEENAQRQTVTDMVNRVLLQGQSVADSVAEAAAAEQAVLDKFNK